MDNNTEVDYKYIIENCPKAVKRLLDKLGEGYTLTEDGFMDIDTGTYYIPHICISEIEELGAELGISIQLSYFAHHSPEQNEFWKQSFIQLEEKLNG